MAAASFHSALWLLLAVGCAADAPPPSGAANGGAGGAAPAAGGAGQGGTTNLGGGSGAGAAGAAAGVSGGVAGSSAGAGGSSAGGAAGGNGASSGSAGGGAAGGAGYEGGAAGIAGASTGGAGMSGGAAGGGAAGGAGMSGGAAGGGSDRCDVGVHDPANPPAMLTLSGSLGTHDPVLIEASERFYLYSTGNGVGAKTSMDLRSFQNAQAVFSTNPSWIAQSVPGATNLWAPDISYFGGQYHLYYSASTFGMNRSCIGHATREALDSGSFTDRGPVVCSNVTTSRDDWNAIDPNVIVDREGRVWLSFGSFWGGIKMVELDEEGNRAGDTLYSLAARPLDDGALEAPFIVRRCGFYYLFVSFDTCCQGVNSTYNLRVGRSASVTGPYVDQEGTEMMEGGGTLLLEGGPRWKGPGHNAVVFSGTRAYNVYHSYDADSNGQSTLRIAELVWDADGWPISAGP
jgi:arabinan endo-1,5-alpha-L-arabinosidase